MAFRLFFAALRILGVAPTVGQKGVALIVGEKTSLILPLCTRLLGCKAGQRVFDKGERAGRGGSQKIYRKSICLFQFRTENFETYPLILYMVSPKVCILHKKIGFEEEI